MAAGKYDLYIEKGTSFERVLTLKESDNSIYDLTGFTAEMDVRETISSETTILSLTTEGSGAQISIDSEEGTITITIDKAVLTAITQSEGVYDLEITDSEGLTTRLIEGKVFFSDEVTRE